MTPFDCASLSLNGSELRPPTVGGSPLASGGHATASPGDGLAGCASDILVPATIADARIECLLLEARPRLGGRAWTTTEHSACPIDLGCGWLHSADRNPWRGTAEAQGRSIDKTPPPWMRPSAPIGFPLSEQLAFLKAQREFHHRLDSLSGE